MTRRPFVIVESPYAGDVVRNLAYARAALADCIRRGETPFASHLLYTQHGVLDDNDHEQRKLGIEMGFEFWRMADAVIFYADYGWSRGMNAAKERLSKAKLGPVYAERTLPAFVDGWNARHVVEGNLSHPMILSSVPTE